MDDPDESDKSLFEGELTRLLLWYFKQLRKRIVEEVEQRVDA